MSEEGKAILRGACMYLFEMYGGPFDMQRDPGAAINIMFQLMIERVL
jgi:hypothetical protein